MPVYVYDYLEEANRLRFKADQFKGRRSELETHLPGVAMKQYASGGETLIRGYYHPSPLGDIVVGNVDRGSLQKSYSRQATTYIYSFDDSGRITRIESVDHGNVWATEFILNCENESTGVLYDVDGNLLRIAEERYQDEKLVEWTVYHIRPEGWEIEHEQYLFENGDLIHMTGHSCTKIAKLPMFALPGLERMIALPEDGVIHTIYDYQDFVIKDMTVSSFSLIYQGKGAAHPKQTVTLKKPKTFSFAPARSHCTWDRAWDKMGQGTVPRPT